MRSRYLLMLPFVVLIIGMTLSCRTKDAEVNVLTDPIKTDMGYISGTIIGDIAKRFASIEHSLCRTARGRLAMETAATCCSLDGNP